MAFATPFSGAALSVRTTTPAAVSRTPPTASMNAARAGAAAVLAAAVLATAPGFASAGIFSEQAVQKAPETANQVFEETATAGNQAVEIAKGKADEMVPGSVGADGARGGGLNMPQAPEATAKSAEGVKAYGGGN